MSCTNGAGGLLRYGDAKDVLSEVYIRMKEAKRETDQTIWGKEWERRDRGTDVGDWVEVGVPGTDRTKKEKEAEKKRQEWRAEIYPPVDLAGSVCLLQNSWWVHRQPWRTPYVQALCWCFADSSSFIFCNNPMRLLLRLCPFHRQGTWSSEAGGNSLKQW